METQDPGPTGSEIGNVHCALPKAQLPTMYYVPKIKDQKANIFKRSSVFALRPGNNHRECPLFFAQAQEPRPTSVFARILLLFRVLSSLVIRHPGSNSNSKLRPPTGQQPTARKTSLLRPSPHSLLIAGFVKVHSEFFIGRNAINQSKLIHR